MAAAFRDVEAATLALDGSPPVTTNHPTDVPCPLPRRIAWVRVSIASPHVRPSPNDRRVGIRIRTFEALCVPKIRFGVDAASGRRKLAS